jgi:enterobacteria phage integrase
VSPRQRSKAKRGWPANLYERNGYYSWRHPDTHVEHGIGRDRAAAFAQAVEANIHVAGLAGQPRLIDRLTGSADRSVEKWNEKYQGLLAKADFAKATLRAYKSLGNRMVTMLKPDTAIASVTALTISEGLEDIAVREGKARTAQALRNFMRDSFREARVQGWYVAENPVLDTKLPVAVEVKRSRLSFEVFMQLYHRAKLEWLRNAMALALVAGQRREDIASAQFKDFHDGGWWCTQASMKGPRRHRIFIPLEIRLDCFGMSLSDVLSQCRRTGVVSKYLIHQSEGRGNSPVGSRIWIDTLSKRFADTVKALELDWGDKQPPTFHEIRSLSERLHAAQGGVNTQELLGHKDPETTAMYHDDRGLDWVRIKVPV